MTSVVLSLVDAVLEDDDYGHGVKVGHFLKMKKEVVPYEMKWRKNEMKNGRIKTYFQLTFETTPDWGTYNLVSLDEFVRRLDMLVTSVFNNFLFEKNDSETRSCLLEFVKEEIKSKDRLYSDFAKDYCTYTLTCDESNNTPEIINRHGLALRIGVQEPCGSSYSVNMIGIPRNDGV
jgi:hypothetical protein